MIYPPLDNVAPATLDGYKFYLRQINEAFGHIKLNRLQPQHITKFYDNLLEDGVRCDRTFVLNPKYTDKVRAQRNILLQYGIKLKTLQSVLKGNDAIRKTVTNISRCLNVPEGELFTESTKKKTLDPETVLHYHRLISGMLNRAVKWGLINSNPAARAEKPKSEQKEALCYDEEQTLLMFELLEKEPLKYRAIIYIAVYGGLRLGEVVGLEWTDIDFGKKSISITKARQYVPEYETYDKDPKTKHSRRKLQISDGALDVLRAYKQEQEETRLNLGDKWQDTGKIFTQLNGLPMFPKTPSHWFNKWLKQEGLPHITFHQLRHTHASILIANGVDIATVSERPGYARMTTTVNRYTYAIKSRDAIAADILDDILTKKPDKGHPKKAIAPK